MKRLTKPLLALAVCSLFLCACGGEKSDCEKADDLRATAFNEVCAAKGDECCICKCWNDGEKVVDDLTACTCKLPPGYDCTGDVKAAAKGCLENADQCRQNVKDVIEAECPTQ